MNNILYVGIDVSQKRNIVCCLDSRGEEVGTRISCLNHLSGSEYFVQELVKRLKGFSELYIGTEATSFYDFHLMEFLANHPQLQAYQPKFYRLNARLVKNFKGTYPNLPKNDHKDAWVIAQRLRFGQLPAPFRPDLEHLPLQRLTRFRLHTAKQLTQEKNYFLTHLFLKFSSYQTIKPFSDPFGATSMAVINEFISSEEILQKPMEELVLFVVEKGRNQFAEPEAIVEKLRQVAKESYRIGPNMAKSLNLLLALSYRNIRQMALIIKELDKAVAEEFKAFPNTLESIPGVGAVYAAGIFAEIGHIEYFPGDAQIAKFAGLFWNKSQSGEYESEDTKIVKRANKYLRYYLVEAANSVRQHVPVYKEFYQKKYKETIKHKHKRALVLTARKFVRLVHVMLTNGTIFKER